MAHQSAEAGTPGQQTKSQPSARRTKSVQILNTDAVKLLKRLEDRDDAVIYVDPPYQNSDNSGYSALPDWAALKETLRKQKSRVAVSGYPGDFEDLGWRSTSTTRNKAVYSMANGMQRVSRTEVLWCNYPAPQTQENLFQ